MTVAYQGIAGAYSEAAASALFPRETLVAHRTFGDVFAALESTAVHAAVVPVENSHAGAVADVYDLLRAHPKARIVAEAVVRVRHCLVGVPGATLESVRVARSHPQALAQSEEFLAAHRIQPEAAYDTAGAAMEVAAAKDPSVAAIASRRAAVKYGLAVLAEGIETSADNFTRFFALARDGDGPAIAPGHLGGRPKTSLVYTTKKFKNFTLRLEQRVGRVDRLGQQRIVHAIHFVGRGSTEAELIDRLIARDQQARLSLDAIGKLTPREKEILDYLTKGYLDKEIAQVLGIRNAFPNSINVGGELHLLRAVLDIKLAYQVQSAPKSQVGSHASVQPTQIDPFWRWNPCASVHPSGNTIALAEHSSALVIACMLPSILRCRSAG